MFLTAKSVNRIYEAFGVPDRAYDGELSEPHIDRLCELLAEAVKRLSSPPQAGCGHHLP